MRYGHIPPDMTLTKPERDADRAAWKALEDENKRLRETLNEIVRRTDPYNGQWEEWPLVAGIDDVARKALNTT